MKATPSSRPRSSRPSGSGTPAGTAEIRAFLSLVRSFAPSPLAPPPVRSLADLTSSLPFAQLLSALDPQAFSLRTLKSPPRGSKDESGDWVAAYNGLRRVHRALVSYAGGSDGQEWSKVKLDLAAMSKGDTEEVLKFCRILFAIAIQVTPGNELLIGKIQTLEQADQQALMIALEPYLPKVPSSTSSPTKPAKPAPLPQANGDSSASQGQERERLRAENETLEAALTKVSTERDALRVRLDEARAAPSQASVSVESQRDNQLLVQEMDRLKAELRQTEDALSEVESALDRQTGTVEIMTKRVDELNATVKENAKLKDQLDELRHASDRLQKAESANKKLSKKLEQTADLRRQMKALEDENAALVDRNSAMEDDFKRSATLRTLADSYKAQVAELEGRERTRSRELTELRFTLEQTQTSLQRAEDELSSQRDEADLTRERIHELEVGGSPTSPAGDSAARLGNSGAEASEAQAAGDLDDALSGRTKTDLKLQIRRLGRELTEARSTQPSQSSDVIVLTNLLEDAKRAKERYEREYLEEHKATLGLKAQLAQIRSGQDGSRSEEAVALRLRLQETEAELDGLKLSHAGLEVEAQQIERELKLAKDDLRFVGKDQTEVLRSLRASVDADKVELDAEVRDLKDRVRHMTDKERMQVDQINRLLIEKVDMQGDTIAKREAQLERERAFGELRVSLAGRAIPEDIKARLLDLQDEKVALAAGFKDLSERLRASESHVQKAKKFIRDQDAMLKDAQKQRDAAGTGDQFAEARQSYETTIADLREEVATLQRDVKDLGARYRQEYQRLLLAFQSLGSKMLRDPGHGDRKDAVQPSGWLGQQRQNLGGSLRR